MRVKVAPAGIEMDAMNCRTGATDDPAKFVLMVIEVKEKEPGGWFPEGAGVGAEGPGTPRATVAGGVDN